MNLLWSLLDEFRDPKFSIPPKDALKLLDGLFLFSLVWSVGGTTENRGRAKFSDFVRKLVDQTVDRGPDRTDFDLGPGLEILDPGIKFGAPMPKEGSVYDYLFDKGKVQWRHWMETVTVGEVPDTAAFNEIIIQTVDTVRYSYLMNVLVTHRKHLLFTGPTGTGKTIYVKAGLDALDRTAYQNIQTAFSAQTNANQVQDIIDNKLDKRRKVRGGGGGGGMGERRKGDDC